MAAPVGRKSADRRAGANPRAGGWKLNQGVRARKTWVGPGARASAKRFEEWGPGWPREGEARRKAGAARGDWAPEAGSGAGCKGGRRPGRSRLRPRQAHGHRPGSCCRLRRCAPLPPAAPANRGGATGRAPAATLPCPEMPGTAARQIESSTSGAFQEFNGADVALGPR